jgi:quinol monooxygenase YgiN
MIHVIAVLTAKPGQRARLLEAFRANLAAVRAEKGCIEYGPTIDAETPLRFQTRHGPESVVVIEKWDSVAALEAHAAAPHMAAFGAKTKEWLASRVIHILAPA